MGCAYVGLECQLVHSVFHLDSIRLEGFHLDKPAPFPLLATQLQQTHKTNFGVIAEYSRLVVNTTNKFCDSLQFIQNFTWVKNVHVCHILS